MGNLTDSLVAGAWEEAEVGIYGEDVKRKRES